MSTEYYTEPNIPWEKILQAKSVDVQDSPTTVYVFPHKVIHKNGSYVYVFLRDGNTFFERFNINRVENIFLSLIEEFGVKFFTEYGEPFDET